VLIASGESYADALAAGPVSYREDYPLVLVPPSGLGDTEKVTLRALGATSAVILGGTNAVPYAIEQQLDAMGVTVTQRLAGNDRTETAAMVASWEMDGIPAMAPYASLPRLDFFGSGVYLARGDGFADALAAGPIAGMLGNPILLTSSPNQLGQGAANYLTSHHLSVSQVQAIGGTSAVSDSTLAAAVADLG
jgi:putative cell wall-binding protein